VLILEILKYAAQGAPQPSPQLASALCHADSQELQWALDAGLAPLICRGVRDCSEGEPISAALADTLLGADLTARVRHVTRVEAALDVMAACVEVGASTTVLKGISISEQCYPAPHLRPMTDIDVHIAGQPYAEIESALLARGYTPGSLVMDADAAHGSPLYSSQHSVWVEIHTSLFPGSSRLRHHPVLADPTSSDHSVAAEFRGQPTRRLRDEAQLLYIASYWTRDLTINPIHPTLVTPLFDAVMLLRQSNATFDWDRLSAWMRDDQATASLALMLSFLSRHSLVQVPERTVERARRGQHLLGPAETAVLDHLVDQYLVAGRPLSLINSWHVWQNLLQRGPRYAKTLLLPWRIAFPPGYPDRFDPAMQADRLRRLIRRLQ